MAGREELLQRAVEAIYEDERLRSNLTDEEACLLLGWAESELKRSADEALSAGRGGQLERVLQAALGWVRRVVADVNDLVGARQEMSQREIRESVASILLHSGCGSAEAEMLADAVAAGGKAKGSYYLVKAIVDHLGIKS